MTQSDTCRWEEEEEEDEEDEVEEDEEEEDLDLGCRRGGGDQTLSGGRNT